jgi:hypothetical protein
MYSSRHSANGRRSNSSSSSTSTSTSTRPRRSDVSSGTRRGRQQSSKPLTIPHHHHDTAKRTETKRTMKKDALSSSPASTKAVTESDDDDDVNVTNDKAIIAELTRRELAKQRKRQQHALREYHRHILGEEKQYDQKDLKMVYPLHVANRHDDDDDDDSNNNNDEDEDDDWDNTQHAAKATGMGSVLRNKLEKYERDVIALGTPEPISSPSNDPFGMHSPHVDHQPESYIIA